MKTIEVAQRSIFAPRSLTFSERSHWFLCALSLIFAALVSWAGPWRTVTQFGAEPWPAVLGFVAGAMLGFFILLAANRNPWHESNICMLFCGTVGLCFFLAGSIFHITTPDRVIVVNGARTSISSPFLVATPFDDIRIVERAWLFDAGVGMEWAVNGVKVKIAESYSVHCLFPSDERTLIRLAKDGGQLKETLRRGIEDAVAARYQGGFFPVPDDSVRKILEDMVKVDLRLAQFPEDICTLVPPDRPGTAQEQLSRVTP